MQGVLGRRIEGYGGEGTIVERSACLRAEIGSIF